MKLGVLFSGGKDSAFAMYLAKKSGHEIACLITISSRNPDSYMFHTPSISQVKRQAECMKVPIIIKETSGKKEKELRDLEKAIIEAKKRYSIQGIVTGAVESVYQSTRIQKICNKLKIECFNPLWQKDQFELLQDLINKKFKIILTGVAAYPLDESWLGKTIDEEFIEKMKILNQRYRINPAGEGGEFESFVLDCPLFKNPLSVVNRKIISSGQNHRMEIDVK